MTDGWSFVFAAYGLAAVVLGAYWRRLVRLDRRLAKTTRPPRAADSRVSAPTRA